MRTAACGVTALLCATIMASLAPAKAAAGPLTLGFDTFAGSEQSSDLGRAAADGAGIVRVNVSWASVAPGHRPQGFVAANPASPGYNWSVVDSALREVAAHGLTAMLTIDDAPRWAEGAHPPSAAQPGSWRIKAKQLAQFAMAAALRYDGKFSDPNNPGRFLPRVRVWQAWNEPNLDFYLSPQWASGPHHAWRPVAPVVYRSMLNAFYAAVKHVSSSNRVIMAGTAPYGDPAGSDPLGRERTPPVTFFQDVFCLSGALKPSCSGSVHLDGVDHHPYGVGGPEWHAANPGDVAIPDVHKLTRVLKAGVRLGHVRPGGHKSVWITEMGWTSKPPNSHGVPLSKDARWYEQAFYVLWRQGVQVVMPTEIRDPKPPVGPNIFQNGLYYYNGHPKPPMVTAYRFPFITQPLKGGKVRAWGRSPATGRLAIQRRSGGRWKTVATVAARRHQVFSRTISVHGSTNFRAMIGSQVSLTWHQSA